MATDPPSDTSVLIGARSQAEAMEWALVLVSQGVESTVHQEAGGWGLLVEPDAADRSHSILARYRAENRRWYWLRRLEAADAPFHGGVAGWVGLLLLVHLWGATSTLPLRQLGCVDGLLVAQGEWWRLLTAVTLHGDASHLLGNLTLGALLLGLAMGRWGAGWALAGGLLGGLVGNVTTLLLHGPAHRCLGASGMVMAGLGLVAMAALQPRGARIPISFMLIRSVVGALLLFILVGLDPATDVVAHAGGLLGGLMAGRALGLLPPRVIESWAWNAVALTTTVVVVLGSWAAVLITPQ